MSTLQIRKLQSGAFKHVDSLDGEFFLGRFSFKQEFNKAFLVEAYGATRRKYSIAEISVYNYLGTAETFTNWTDLLNRLTDLGYTGIETNGIIPTGAYLSDDPTQYLDAPLPLTGTEVAILNNGTNWVSITWDNIKAQLKTYFDTLYQLKLVSATNIKTINGTSILGSGDLVVSGGGSNKRTVCFTYEFNGALNTATNNWWSAVGNGTPSILVNNATLTPSDNFSSAHVQSPAWVVPFNCRLKSIIFKGFSNTGAGVVDLAFTSGTYLGSGATLVNNTILSNQPFTLHNYLGVSGFSESLYVFDTGFTNYVIPKGYEIRMFMNNRNVGKNLLSTIIIIEFEEEI